MDLDIKKVGKTYIVKPLSKNIDVTVSTEFKSKFSDLFKNKDKLFIMDLGEVHFIDSSGLGVIISLFKSIKMENGHLVLCHINSPVLSLFEITRMNQVFDIFDTEKKAIDFINKS
jgi:anti-anti-sigma factor